MLTETDVLVVGGGPTGLVAAVELARRGVRCRIVDKALVRSEKSRALIVQPRTLEVLQRMGALGDLIERGQRSLSVNIHANGRRVAHVVVDDIGLDDTPYPFLLFVSQVETERVLENRLSALGVEIERGLELVGLSDSGAHVDAELQGPAGSQTIRARYVVGADGAHSAVRRLLGLRFDGDAYVQDFALADVDIAWEHPPGGVHMFFTRSGPFVCLPLRGERAYRLIMVRAEDGGDGDPTLDEVRERARTAIGGDVGIDNPAWLARFRLHHRGVDHYRKGRVFVAGDAAHIHSPAGGQGMNTGIQDAFNLGWKLALAVQERAPEALLDSYHVERHPIGQNLLRFTDRIFRLGSSNGWLIAQLRRFVVPRVIPFVLKNARRRARAFEFISQVGIRYDWSPIVEEPRGRRTLAKSPAGGWRAPDVPLGDTTLFHRMAEQPGFHLLCFAPGPQAPERIAQLAAGWPDGVTPVFLQRAPAGTTASVLADADGLAFRRYGIAESGFVLVRPDGYIATRAGGDDPTPIRDYLKKQGLATSAAVPPHDPRARADHQ